MTTIPTHAQVVIVGGGIVGCSVAYHLAKRGCTDVVLLERKQLTSGTTWHAAGLVGQLRATHNLTKLAMYTTELFATLEAETEQATGFMQRGSVSVAPSEARFEELKRNASMARLYGLEVDVVTPKQIQAMVPLARVDDLVGGVWLPNDGQTNPIDTTQALAKGARNRGVKIFENVKVNRIVVEDSRAVGVTTDAGEIRADIVVNCAGMWARQLADDAGAVVPLHAAEHFYIVTEHIESLSPSTPVLRDPDGCGYFKEDAGKLLVGWFEPVAKPWGMKSIPEEFSFDSLPEDFEHIEPLMASAVHRMPILGETGIRLFFNGPESFTPDDRFILGESPDVKGMFVAAGFNSIGIQASGGAGKVLADWIIDGRAPMDLWDIDIRRMMPFQRNRSYLHDRTVESLGLLYAMHWPYRQPETARGVRRSPVHDRLAAMGACFGELAGWERANWFAPPGVAPVYEYSYGRQNWFDYSASEHHAVRNSVGLFDQTSFAKFRVEGPDAERFLNNICANDVATVIGKIVYTQWLNDRGGIEADLTVTREAQNRFLVVTAPATQIRDLHWLTSHITAADRVVVTDVTSGSAVFSVMGPNSRRMLQAITPCDLSNETFPFGTSQEIDLGYARVRANRVTYVGELGWELYVLTEFAAGVFDTLIAAGKPHDLRLAGYHALNSLRMEKGYRHWSHDVSPDNTPLEAGLGFAIAWDKPNGFIGRDALVKQRDEGLHTRLVQFALTDPNELVYHNEPILRDGKIVGKVTSGMYGHTLNQSLAMGYITSRDGRIDAQYIASGSYEIEVAGRRIPATASPQPPYDPTSSRVRM